MSRFDRMEFGEAAPYLRKSELELLTSHAVPFDGRESFSKLISTTRIQLYTRGKYVLTSALHLSSFRSLFHFHKTNVIGRVHYKIGLNCLKV